MYDYRRNADPQVGFRDEAEAEEVHRRMWQDALAEVLYECEQSWRCQLGSELFAAAVDCARAGLVTHELFAWLDSDMIADTGDDRWHHNAPALVYGPHLPWWHPVARQEVDDELPF